MHLYYYQLKTRIFLESLFFFEFHLAFYCY
uniref:Uncharacterized protein n=1 Tax=Rhizophora mucronata TaxID=61149 RepID=A0A2P2II81_RHIMU